VQRVSLANKRKKESIALFRASDLALSSLLYLTHLLFTSFIINSLGQFKTLLDPGFHCMKWPLTQIVGRLSLRIQQLDVFCETKSKDNVFVQVAVAVQYKVLAEFAYDAFYRLTDARGQIQSYVFDVVRSTVPKMELDEAFASKDEIATAVLQQLQDVMKEYGYEIRNTLVTDLSPDSKVKASMNEINASRRLKEATSHKAEADKTRQVKAAEAEAEARYLSGMGVARQRKAIVQGLQKSVSEFANDVEGARPKDVMVSLKSCVHCGRRRVVLHFCCRVTVSPFINCSCRCRISFY
jgi:regulator of protease activity HflC (stomatin/prohibitin superfamily)